ncbi:MAG TPA: histidine phosphatase family protein [Stellaceae bacterium]|nr:histidine phosphatase family protein [Stellaceae bacterium]
MTSKFTTFALIRHMPTVWNAEGRLQGQRDTPLDPAAIPDWRLPPELAGFRFLASPLARTLATAERLGVSPQIEPRLIEMSWGEWEGHTLAELRASFAGSLDELEAQGLDFRTPGGESPRDVQARVGPLLAEIAASGRPTAAVTHKGVIRPIFALATGWNMLGKQPYRLSWSAAHLFRLDADGHPSIDRLNLSLER